MLSPTLNILNTVHHNGPLPTFALPPVSHFISTPAQPRITSAQPVNLQQATPKDRLERLQTFPHHQVALKSTPHEKNSVAQIQLQSEDTQPNLSLNLNNPNDPEQNDVNEYENLECNHLGHFITEDGYPLDVYIDKAIADRNISDINSIYDFKYSLNHDDRNGHRTLHISDHFPINESFYAKMMKDTIYGQWIQVDDAPVLDLSMHVNNNQEGKGPAWETGAHNNELIPTPLAQELAKIGGEMRKKIFTDHIQDALQAMALGTTTLLDQHPKLRQAPTQLRYLSDIPDIQETVQAGLVQDHLDKPVLDNKNPIAQIAHNVQIWGDAMQSSSKAMRQLLDAVLKPESLGPLLSNPKTLLPTLTVLIALGLVTTHNITK